LFEVRISKDRFKGIEMRGRLKAFWHLRVPFAEVPDPVSRFPHQIGEQMGQGFRLGHIRLRRRAKGSCRQTGQDRRPTDPADRMADEHVFKADALSRQPVDRRGLHDRMAGAPQRVVPLVIGKEEQDIGPLGPARLGNLGQAAGEQTSDRGQPPRTRG
jgi:hypothetical protein